MKRAIFLLLIINAHWNYAQELIQVGEWRTHFSYEQTNLVEVVNQKIFASTSNSIMIYDVPSDELMSFSRVDGLSDIDITALVFDTDHQKLMIGYENGNIDVITGSDVHNIPVLFNSQIVDSKKILGFSSYENTINVVTDFGVLVIDEETDIVVESYQNLGQNGEKISIRNSTFQGNIMYLATSEGVLSGDRASGENLRDFNNWERFDGSAVQNQNVNSVALFEGAVYAALDESVAFYENQNWTPIPDFLSSGDVIKKLERSNEILVISTNMGVYELNPEGNISQVSIPNGLDRLDVVRFADDNYFIATENDGLVNSANGLATEYKLEGPLNNIQKLKFESGIIYGFPELEKEINTPASNGRGYSQFVEGHWVNTSFESPISFDNISDEVIIGENQYFGSFGNGVLEANSSTVFNTSNSTLQPHSGNEENILISGIGSDRNDNLWVASMDSFPLHVMDAEGNWERFSFGFSASHEPTTLNVNRNGSVWMTLGFNSGTGVMAYDPELQISRYITATNSTLTSNRVNEIVFDLDNEIWMATSNGVVYFPFSNGVIADPTIDVIRPVFEDNYLFQNKNVTCMAVDGGNRKWMGTLDGLWLFEDNGSRLIHHFDTSNSPLPSDNILSLAIHQTTGEVFISTDRGVMSFRSDATAGTTAHQNVKIFPNPVLPDYSGLVGFDGLARDTNLKITTVSGRLVRKINAAGSGASWDMADYNGRRVNTGVYLVFSSNDDGSETFVGKIAVID